MKMKGFFFRIKKDVPKSEPGKKASAMSPKIINFPKIKVDDESRMVSVGIKLAIAAVTFITITFLEIFIWKSVPVIVVAIVGLMTTAFFAMFAYYHVKYHFPMLMHVERYKISYVLTPIWYWAVSMSNLASVFHRVDNKMWFNVVFGFFQITWLICAILLIVLGRLAVRQTRIENKKHIKLNKWT